VVGASSSDMRVAVVDSGGSMGEHGREWALAASKAGALRHSAAAGMRLVEAVAYRLEVAASDPWQENTSHSEVASPEDKA